MKTFTASPKPRKGERIGDVGHPAEITISHPTTNNADFVRLQAQGLSSSGAGIICQSSRVFMVGSQFSSSQPPANMLCNGRL